MLVGIKSYVDGDYCTSCDAKISTTIHNFCPNCGNPLNSNALKFKEQQNKRIKIELLDELALNITDANSLKVVLDKVKSL